MRDLAEYRQLWISLGNEARQGGDLVCDIGVARMFLIRSAFWIALIVALIPSDPAQQAKMYQTASYAVHRAATFCDRNAGVCDSAHAYWEIFKVKAAAGGRMVGDLVNERLLGPEASRIGARPASRSEPPLLERSHPAADTLQPADRTPEWRVRSRTQL